MLSGHLIRRLWRPRRKIYPWRGHDTTVCSSNQDDARRLGNVAYKLSGGAFLTLPNTGLVFDGYRIVGYDKAKMLIEKAHPMVPYFKMVSWGVVIDEQGEAVMMDANFAKGYLTFHQLTKGPLFGDDTKDILDEVFLKNK